MTNIAHQPVSLLIIWLTLITFNNTIAIVSY